MTMPHLIERTARKIGDANSYNSDGHSPHFGYGCINAVAAVTGLTEEADGGAISPFWGDKGHRLTNQIAISAVPEELGRFYDIHLDAIVQHAMDADTAKNSNPAEKPHHFIDIDLYGEYPFSELPEDFDQAVHKFGEQTVIGRGLLPWQIELTYNNLVQAFRDQNLEGVLRHSAWLGHYVGDSHVPFHTTANHDGQLTGQRGLHSYFEARLLDRYVPPSEIKPDLGQRIRELPHTLAFRWVRESYSFVQALLDADAANGGKTKKRKLSGFAITAKPIAVDRLTKGSTRLASLWYSAWLGAGRPSLSELSDSVPEPDTAPVLAGR